MRDKFIERVTKLLEAGSELNYLTDIPPDSGEIIENISYIDDGKDAHKLDIIYPMEKSDKYPFIINIHGGGFAVNTKDRIYRNYAMRLAGDRYAVVNINFRLSNEINFPTQMTDVLAVINFIENNSEKYSLDKGNMFLCGDSSGAYMAAMAECILTNPVLSDYYNFTTAMTCRALAVNCGIFDFSTFMGRDVHFPLRKEIVLQLFGDKNYKELDVYKYSSVLKYITKDFCPTYIMDTQIQSFEAEALRLEKALIDKLIPYKLHIFHKKEKLLHVFNISGKYEQSAAVLKETFEFFAGYV
ncbi:MAG TPA: alpha/beta hydrolase [Clostridiales bacterium]|nr:alpha/beta hydrolase [Clostridiales bacterium]